MIVSSSRTSFSYEHFLDREPYMPTAIHTPDPRRGAARRASVEGVVLFGAVVLAALAPALARAQSSPDRGYVLKVPSALDTKWIDTHKKFINNRLDRFEKE